MNNIQELIERPLRNAIDHIQHECYNDALSSIHEAIAALESMQAPLPGDIEYQLQTLRWESAIISIRQQNHIADMLERLAYENQCHILARKQDKQRIKELEQRYGDDEIATSVNLAWQQRIEELEKAPLPEDVADAVSVLRAEYDPHWIADMLERLWRENKARIDKQDKTMLAYESRIKRLNAALAELQNHVWLDIGDQKFFNRVYDKARAGDILDDHCLTPDEYDGKARAGE